VRLRVAVRGVPPAPQLIVAIDGVVTAPRGLKLTTELAGQPPVGPDELVQELDLDIPPRDCTVSVRAATAPGDREAALVRLRWSGAPFVSRPNLYVLAVGVGTYQRPQLALRYPAKDAWDVTQAFKRQAGRLYNKVITEVLVDEGATYLAILRKLEWLRRQTTAQDVAVLFLAGHGLNDPTSGEYYFLAHDADPANILTTMVSQHQLQSALRNTAGKVLLFLDTCHSGNVFPEWRTRGLADSQRWVQELAGAEGGVIAFTAATGRQQSKESDAWENGAFSKALVEGLLGRAAYHPDRPITVNMLELYISERVKHLTGGTQTPTTAKPSTISDFPIAVYQESLAPLDVPMRRPTTLPIYKRWWFWTAIAGGVALAAGLGAILALPARDAQVPPGVPVFDPSF
jgi:hypothetical protein